MSQPPKRKATGNTEGSGARPGQPSQRPRAAGSGGGSRPAGSRPSSYNSRGRAPQPPPPTTSPLMWVGIVVGVIVVLVLAYVLVSPPWKNATVAAVNPTPTTAANSNTGNTAPPPTTGVSNVNTSGQPQHITVQHILIGFKDAVGFQGSAPPKAAARTQEEAKTLAYQVLDMAKKGQDYDQLVAQYTDDQAPGIYKMSNSGVAPLSADEYSRDGMVPAFGNVGFTLQVGEIGIADYDPATSPYGWHIIKRVN